MNYREISTSGQVTPSACLFVIIEIFCPSQVANFFPRLFQSVDPGQQFTWENSNLEVNKPKNRYANVIAYDHSRVILSSIEGKMHSSLVFSFFCDCAHVKKKLGMLVSPFKCLNYIATFWCA